MNAEQLLLAPRYAFREIELAAPLSIRRLCAAPRPPRRRARAPERWIPGTAPTVHLPLAGSGRTRTYRIGRKPASIGTGRLSDAERREKTLLEWELGAEGVRFGPPETWQECVDELGDEPCPHVSCSANLYLDVLPPRSPGQPPLIKLNFPGLDIDEIPETCSHRAAAKGGATLEEVGIRLNITMGRAEQLEKLAIRKLAAVAEAQGWGERFAKFVAARGAKH
jgi:hypothetical protein